MPYYFCVIKNSKDVILVAFFVLFIYLFYFLFFCRKCLLIFAVCRGISNSYCTYYIYIYIFGCFSLGMITNLDGNQKNMVAFKCCTFLQTTYGGRISFSTISKFCLYCHPYYDVLFYFTQLLVFIIVSLIYLFRGLNVVLV